MKRTYHGLPQTNLTMVVVDEITIFGSRCMRAAPAGPATDGHVPLIHTRYPLEQGELAFGHVQRAEGAADNGR